MIRGDPFSPKPRGPLWRSSMGPLSGAGWIGVPCSAHNMLRAPYLGPPQDQAFALGPISPPCSLGRASFSRPWGGGAGKAQDPPPPCFKV